MAVSDEPHTDVTPIIINYSICKDTLGNAYGICSIILNLKKGSLSHIAIAFVDQPPNR